MKRFLCPLGSQPEFGIFLQLVQWFNGSGSLSVMGSDSRLPPCLPEQGASRFQASLGDLGNPEANKSGMLSDGKQFRPRLRSSVTIDRNVNPSNIPFFMTLVGETFQRQNGDSTYTAEKDQRFNNLWSAAILAALTAKASNSLGRPNKTVYCSTMRCKMA